MHNRSKELQIADLLDPATTGLLVVDAQNGFCHPNGELGRLGQGESLQRVVPRIAEVVAAADDAGIRRYFSRQEHDPNDVSRERHRIRTHIAKARHLPAVRGTWDAEILSDLQKLMHDKDYVFTKHRASCFYCTSLEVQLRMDGVTTLIIIGVTTNYCVDATIRDAYARDFDIIVVEDCCAARDEELHRATLKNTELFHGLVSNKDELLAALRATHAVQNQ